MASAALPTLPPVRSKRRQRKLSRCDRDLPQPVEPTGGHASQIMADALWIEQVAADEAAQASGRDTAWIQGVVDGTVDPTLDELELALNAIGLETRIGLGLPGEPWPPAISHDRERIAEKIRRHRALDMEMYGRVWIRRGPPQPGATARLFGAGPGREDGGGWAAVLVRNVFECLAISEYEFAQRVGTSPSEVERLVSGAGARPSAKDVEQLLARLGVPMAIRIEEYCDDDDYEHGLWWLTPQRMKPGSPRFVTNCTERSDSAGRDASRSRTYC